MDILQFWEIIWRRKWWLITTAGIAVVLTFLLMGLRRPVYKSNAILSTGITLEKRIELSKEDVFVQKYEIESAFSNLIANMKSRTSLRLLTYRLLLHDLYAERTTGQAFRKLPSDAEITAGEEEIRKLVLSLQERTADTTSFHDPLPADQEALLKELAKAYEYDFESLEENLHIDRLGETDYVKIEFESEDPYLCVYAVDNFTEDFMAYHMQNVSKDEYDALRFYEELAREKEARVKSVSNQLSAFRRAQMIVNMDEQSRSVVALLKDLEYNREQARQGIPAHRRNIARLNKDLDQMLAGRGNRTQASALIKERFSSIQDEIKEIRAAGLGDDTNAMYVNQLDIKRQYRDSLLEEMAGLLMNDPDDEEAGIMQDLLSKRIDEEISLTLKEEADRSLSDKIIELQQQSETLVSAEEQLEMLESQKEIALQEYLHTVGKLNEAKVVAQSALNPLSIFEYAQLPEEPEPSKRLTYSAFAGVATAGMGVFILFFLTLFDNSLSSSAKFEKLTGTRLLGELNQLPGKEQQLSDIFDREVKDEYLIFRESLRKIRHEIEVSGAKRFLLTSTRPQSGKSLILLSLAYTLSKKDQSVLILDTNFKNNTLSEYATIQPDFNPLSGNGNTQGEARRESSTDLPPTKGEIAVIGNQSTSDSPSEILAGQNVAAWLQELEQQYDYILMEGPALNDFSDTRELTDYVDKVIVVFNATDSLTQTDRESLRFLEGLGNTFMGSVLNNVHPRQLKD